MSDRDITTTDGEVFTHESACQMAELVYLRFGKDLKAASEAWSRMMQNDTSPAQFAGLIEDALVYKLRRPLRRYAGVGHAERSAGSSSPR